MISAVIEEFHYCPFIRMRLSCVSQMTCLSWMIAETMSVVKKRIGYGFISKSGNLVLCDSRFRKHGHVFPIYAHIERVKEFKPDLQLPLYKKDNKPIEMDK